MVWVDVVHLNSDMVVWGVGSDEAKKSLVALDVSGSALFQIISMGGGLLLGSLYSI